ncbi:hypothetical protein J7L67_10065 [bacterium]|nr:hypothetical protein [bacterium]
MVDLKLNRSIYLARRDKFYLLAANHLCEDFLTYPLSRCSEYIDLILKFFIIAKQQALYSMRGKDIDENINVDESNFFKSLELVIEELNASRIILKHNEIIRKKDSFLTRFIGEISFSEPQIDSSKMIVDIIIKHVRVIAFRLTERFEELRKKCFASLTEEQKIRYNMMFDYDENIKEIK